MDAPAVFDLGVFIDLDLNITPFQFQLECFDQASQQVLDADFRDRIAISFHGDRTSRVELQSHIGTAPASMAHNCIVVVLSLYVNHLAAFYAIRLEKFKEDAERSRHAVARTLLMTDFCTKILVTQKTSIDAFSADHHARIVLNILRNLFVHVFCKTQNRFGSRLIIFHFEHALKKRFSTLRIDGCLGGKAAGRRGSRRLLFGECQMRGLPALRHRRSGTGCFRIFVQGQQARRDTKQRKQSY